MTALFGHFCYHKTPDSESFRDLPLGLLPWLCSGPDGRHTLPQIPTVLTYDLRLLLIVPWAQYFTANHTKPPQKYYNTFKIFGRLQPLHSFWKTPRVQAIRGSVTQGCK